jgi:TonB family protein
MRCLLVAIAIAGLASGPSRADDWLTRASCKPEVGQDFYPAPAIGRNQVGTVLVEFSVQGKGPPDHVIVIGAKASQVLKDGASRFMRLLRCDPDPKWMDDGGPQRRIRLNVIFRLKGWDETPERLDPDADQVVITGSAIMRR